MNYILFMGVRMVKVKVEVEINIPEGYEVVGKDKAHFGDLVLNGKGQAEIWFGPESEREYYILRRLPKKQRKVIKFRNYLTKFGAILTYQSDSGLLPERIEENKDFVAWIGDWQQIEIEEQ